MWAMQKFKHFLGGGQPFEVYTDHAILKTLMTHENPSPRRARWIEKMAPFNFTIHYRPGVKMGHADFASRMDTFLPKDSTSTPISTLRAQQKQPELSPKRNITSTRQPFNPTHNKKTKPNPMAFPRKVEIIRRKKTHNGHYCQQCRIYYQGYRHRCLTPQPQPQPQPQSQPQPQLQPQYQYHSRSPTTESEGGGWINSNLMIVKPKQKSPIPKEFDSWPKLDPNKEWDRDQLWDGPEESE